jgi:hypothetical protein
MLKLLQDALHVLLMKRLRISQRGKHLTGSGRVVAIPRFLLGNALPTFRGVAFG